MIHIIVLLFFTVLLVYSLFRTISHQGTNVEVQMTNIVEGLDNNNDTNLADIISIKKDLNELSNIDTKISGIDTQSKINAREINILNMKIAQMRKK